ncbi:hypothetical protein BKA93DRAFT_820196 [Sparassis latifolia]|uniref:SPT2-domain-containing protein n=1 Tax=Sparassis crispa TaxID=139825 RepID=A0A401H1H3_9APHY|nr:hypothetical protein SCP_1300340 [Sparassis crispa]GBE88220.1 hypothetical protein SCP_1300340 [Sparassis crispa]
MSTSFAALMALSATQTRQSDAAVQSALAERQRKEAQRRKEQEDRDRREREVEAKLRLKRLEDEKREQERQRRLEEERGAKEREQRRKQEQERDALRYGPKKARTDKNGYPVSGAARRRSSSSDDESAGANALTREEKRRRRLESEMRGRSAPRRSTHTGYSKAGRRLPGGAVDITTTEASFLSEPSGSQSIRERVAAEPAKLIKLNVNKRDTRTIDEILQDRAKARAKTLDGDQARSFSDWFGKGKKESPKKPTPQIGSASTSRDNTPGTKTSSGYASPAAHSAGLPKVPPAKSSAASATITSKAGARQLTRAPSALASRPAASSSKSLQKNAPSNGSIRAPVPRRSPASFSAKASTSTSKPAAKKRPRSPSMSPTPSPPPPSKKRAPERGGSALGAEIWKIFGKDRTAYTARDVLSDDEDMEADVRSLEFEEAQSSRIAKREEEAAIEEERRHEEEKRRRRKEKELREKRA